MSTPGFEEVIIRKMRELEVGQAHLREELALLSALGGPVGPTQGVVTNIDRTLELMEGFYFNILESMGQAVVAYDLDRRIFYWNKHAETLFECSKEDAIGNDILSILVNPNLYSTALGIINRVKRGASWIGQFPIELQLTGKKLLAIVSIDPFYDDNATLVGLIAVVVDSKPYFEIKYSMSKATHIESHQVFRRSESIITSSSKLTTLATKFIDRVRSKMKKTGARDVSRAGGSEDSRLSDHENEDDGNRIEASTSK